MARNAAGSSFLVPLILLTSGLLGVEGHPVEEAVSGKGADPRLDTVWSLENLNQENELEARRDQALEKLQEVLGIRSHGERSGQRKIPPQFMMELYNNVADPSGVTRGRNPYNAKVVRSFIERGKSVRIEFAEHHRVSSPNARSIYPSVPTDTTMSQFYFFNISGLEVNESVLEAELHLYRKKTPLEVMHPSTFVSPHYLIRVYQVLDDRSLDVPDVHRLLNVRYVGAHGSGWQIFNVKQAVLEWLAGEPNLGLLVTASTLFEDQVSIEFFRRTEYHHSKQPILVLFDDDGREHRPGKKLVSRYYAYGNDDREHDGLTYDNTEERFDLEEEYEAGHASKRMLKKRRGQSEEPETKPEYFQRQKKPREGKGSGSREDKRHRREASRDRYEGAPTSMEIYERAILREKEEAAESLDNSRFGFKRDKRSSSSPSSAPSSSSSSSSSGSYGSNRGNSSSECSRQELYVDFKEIGLSSSIIAPLGYSAYHCTGVCETPLSQELQPTNHATIQGIVHKMALVKGIQRPCCVPTKLLGTTILFFDDNENVVLKVYQDMIADRCGCR